MKNCPYCSAELLDEAFVCRSCGSDFPTAEKITKTKIEKIISVAVIAFLIILLIGFSTWFYLKTTRQNTEIAQLNNDLEIMAGNYVQSTMRASLLETEIANLDATQAAGYITQTAAVGSVEATRIVANDLYLTRQANYSAVIQDREKLKEQLFCEDKFVFEPDYTDAQAMLEALKKYMKIYSGKEPYSYHYDTLWSDSKDLSYWFQVNPEDYNLGYEFLVFWGEEEGIEKGVFFSNHACWMDLPE